MLLIGLTGGIASGKSEAAARFAALGVPVLDADQIARELVAPGQPLLAEIFATFGDDLRLPDGSLDRAALGRRVFAQPAERQHLEHLLHPKIRAEMLHRANEFDTPYVILMAPVLIESGMTDVVDRILVIDAPESLQRARSCQRDKHEPAYVEQIMAAQVDRQTRLAAADDVILNTGDLGELDGAVAQLHQRYLKLSAHR
jgi:dephospho-CoA kinase